MDNNIAIKLQNVTKKVGHKVIIDQLSFDVPKGEVFGFLGPNGAGKTTTIRMIVGLISMSSGKIYINGEDVAKSFEKAISHVGAIVENPEMYGYLTGCQNLLHYSRMHPNISKERIQEVIKLVGLEQRIHEKVKKYSLGMRQRLGVAQAILHKPAVLILDEPTNGLDPSGIRELRDYLRSLSENEGTAVVVSSHLLSEMELMCDRVAIIQSGKLVDIQILKGLTNKVDPTLSIALEVDDVTKALEVLNERKIEIIDKEGNTLHFVLQKNLIPDLNKTLVQKNVGVFEISTATKSLEDKFMEITRGEQIV